MKTEIPTLRSWPTRAKVTDRRAPETRHRRVPPWFLCAPGAATPPPCGFASTAPRARARRRERTSLSLYRSRLVPRAAAQRDRDAPSVPAVLPRSPPAVPRAPPAGKPRSEGTRNGRGRGPSGRHKVSPDLQRRPVGVLAPDSLASGAGGLKAGARAGSPPRRPSSPPRLALPPLQHGK